MKLLIQQRFLSWLDKYDIYDEKENTVYTVEGQFSFGKCLNIIDDKGEHIATVRQQILTFRPQFDIYIGESYIGTIIKTFSLFEQSFDMDYLGWYVTGDFMGWDYEVKDSNENTIAVITKELFNMTDTYCIDVIDNKNALNVLVLVLVIDAVNAPG